MSGILKTVLASTFTALVTGAAIVEGGYQMALNDIISNPTGAVVASTAVGAAIGLAAPLAFCQIFNSKADEERRSGARVASITSSVAALFLSVGIISVLEEQEVIYQGYETAMAEKYPNYPPAQKVSLR